jgi:hypothetical protein
MRRQRRLSEVLPDRGAAALAAWRAGDQASYENLIVGRDELDGYVAILKTLMANPKSRNAARFVVTCPRGHPMGRVYVVKGKTVFVSVTRFDGTNIGGNAASMRRHPSFGETETRAAALTEQAVEYFDFLNDGQNRHLPLRAQCECRFRQIPRQWLLDRLAEGRHGAVFGD